MAELNHFSKIQGPFTLKSGYADGHVAVEVWYENKMVAKFNIEFLWDFMAETFLDNPPENVPGSKTQVKNYMDFGSRYYCMLAADRLRNVETK